MSLGDKLVGRLESKVAMGKNVNVPLSGTWAILLNWHEPFRVDGCGTDAGERKDDNAMGSVAGITKGCGWAPFLKLVIVRASDPDHHCQMSQGDKNSNGENTKLKL